jgi:hypothetical protein
VGQLPVTNRFGEKATQNHKHRESEPIQNLRDFDSHRQNKRAQGENNNPGSLTKCSLPSAVLGREQAKQAAHHLCCQSPSTVCLIHPSVHDVPLGATKAGPLLAFPRLENGGGVRNGRYGM